MICFRTRICPGVLRSLPFLSSSLKNYRSVILDNSDAIVYCMSISQDGVGGGVPKALVFCLSSFYYDILLWLLCFKSMKATQAMQLGDLKTWFCWMAYIGSEFWGVIFPWTSDFMWRNWKLHFSFKVFFFWCYHLQILCLCYCI